jgi:hypothetical protein
MIVTFDVLIFTILVVRGINLPRVISSSVLFEIIEEHDGIIRFLILLGTLSIFIRE